MHLSRENILWICYLIIGFVLLIGTNEQRLHKANLISTTVYYPLISSVNQIEELLSLRERNRDLAYRLAYYKILANRLENDLVSVRTVLNIGGSEELQYDEQIEYAIASVVAYRGSFSNRTLIINKGSLDGIKMSQPVISEKGIVGKIINVFPKHALVLPMTSPHFKLGVITKNSSVQGLLEADISGNLYMTMITPGSNITVGDDVITSSVSTVFPRGYPIGTITRLQKTAEDVYLRAVVNPFTKVNDLEQVIVLFYSKDLPEE